MKQMIEIILLRIVDYRELAFQTQKNLCFLIFKNFPIFRRIRKI